MQEKLDLQGDMMPESFFADAEDCVCPVTTVSRLLKDHDISRVDLLKVCCSLAVSNTGLLALFKLCMPVQGCMSGEAHCFSGKQIVSAHPISIYLYMSISIYAHDVMHTLQVV